MIRQRNGAVRRLGSALAVLIALAGCASSSVRADPAAFAARLAGAYDNTAQWSQRDAATRAALGAAPVTVRFVRVHAPRLGDAVLYEEWRSTDRARTTVRQTIWSVRPAGAGLRIERFTLRAPARHVGAGADSFADLAPSDVASLGWTCALEVTLTDAQLWTAETRRDFCRVGGEVVNTQMSWAAEALTYAETSAPSSAQAAAPPLVLRRQ